MAVEVTSVIRGGRESIFPQLNYQRAVSENCERLNLKQVAIVYYPADFAADGDNCDSPPYSMSIALGNITYDDGRPKSDPMPVISVNLDQTEQWSEEALRATVAHEFGHYVNGDCRKKYGKRGQRRERLIRLVNAVCFVYSRYSFIWRREYKADIYAAELVGLDTFEALFSEVINNDLRNVLTHPSCKKRRRNIERHFGRAATPACALAV